MQMIYICKYCNYQTDKKTSFTLHNSSAKHKQNVTSPDNPFNQLWCMKCNIEYTSKSNATRHKKTCRKQILEKQVINDNPHPPEVVDLVNKLKVNEYLAQDFKQKNKSLTAKNAELKQQDLIRENDMLKIKLALEEANKLIVQKENEVLQAKLETANRDIHIKTLDTRMKKIKVEPHGKLAFYKQRTGKPLEPFEEPEIHNNDKDPYRLY